MKVNKLIFVIGVRRSGTNLLRAMLGSHPYLYAHNSDLNEELDSIGFGDMRKLKIENITEKLTNYLYKLTSCPEDKTLVIKNHFLLKDAEFIDKALPNSYVIHILRDPRGAFASRINLKHIGHKEVVHTIPELVDDYNKIYNDFRKAKDILGEKIIRIRYEDLCSNPEGSLRVICNFLEIEYHSDMLDFENKWNMQFKGGLNVNKRSNSSFQDASANKLIYTESVDRWKDILTKEQIEEIETQITLERLKEYGYEKY